MQIDLHTSTEIAKIAAYYGVERDEVINDAWILQATEPALTGKAFFARLSSICLQSNKVNGLMGIEKCSVDADMASEEASTQCYGMSPESALIKAEEEAEIERKIAGLSSKQRARLAATEQCRTIGDFGVKNGMPFSTAQRKLEAWLKEEDGQVVQMTVEMF